MSMLFYVCFVVLYTNYEDCKMAHIRSKFGWKNVAGGYYNAMLIYFVYNI